MEKKIVYRIVTIADYEREASYDSERAGRRRRRGGQRRGVPVPPSPGAEEAQGRAFHGGQRGERVRRGDSAPAGPGDL